LILETGVIPLQVLNLRQHFNFLLVHFDFHFLQFGVGLLLNFLHGFLVLLPLGLHQVLIFLIEVLQDKHLGVELIDLLITVLDLVVRRLHGLIQLSLQQIVVFLERLVRTH